jgi:ABC-2 type transport system permease protein
MNRTRIVGAFLRYFYTLRRGMYQLTDLFYWPFVDILIWGLTSVWVQSQSHVQNLPLLLMTGLIFWQICWRSSIDISGNLLQDFWQRNLINLFASPLKISEWITGILLLSLCKLCITIGFGSLLVFLLYSLNVFVVGWAFLPFAASLLIFGWALSFISSSLIIYWGHRVEMLAWMVGSIFAPFSAVFYPVDILPGWAQHISYCLPTTYIFEGMRMILRSGSFPTHYFWISLGLDGLYLFSSILLFLYSFKKSSAKGLARLE